MGWGGDAEEAASGRGGKQQWQRRLAADLGPWGRNAKASGCERALHLSAVAGITAKSPQECRGCVGRGAWVGGRSLQFPEHIGSRSLRPTSWRQECQDRRGCARISHLLELSALTAENRARVSSSMALLPFVGRATRQRGPGAWPGEAAWEGHIHLPNSVCADRPCVWVLYAKSSQPVKWM